VKLQADRKAGEMLAVMDKNKGGRPANKTAVTMTEVSAPSLFELGVNENQSRRWQREAAVDDETFKTYHHRLAAHSSSSAARG